MNKRTLLAFVLAIVFFIVYSNFILPLLAPAPSGPAPGDKVAEPSARESDAGPAAAREPTDASAPESTAGESSMAAVADSTPAQTAEASEEEPAVDTAVGAVPEKYLQEKIQPGEVEASTDLLTVTFTKTTGSLKSVALIKFENFERTGPMVLLKDFSDGDFPTAITEMAGEDLSAHLWVLESYPENGDPFETKEVVFATVVSSGLKVTKTYSLYPGKYGLGLTVKIENTASGTRKFDYELLGPMGVPSEDYRRADVSAVLASVPAAEGLAGKMEMELLPAVKLEKGNVPVPPGMRANYAGAINRYFASVLRPHPTDVPLAGTVARIVGDSEHGRLLFGDKDPREAVEQYAQKDRQKYLREIYHMAGISMTVGEVSLAPAGSDGSSAEHSFILYCGPKNEDALAGFDTVSTKTGFSQLLKYGWLEPLVKVILYLMKAFHAVIPNWGVSILLLTFLMRLFMHPLTRKSQVSMAKMQKLQPQIKKLQEKHKNDKQKLGAEQMRLMKEHGANPLGGCLPMLIQLPIFFSLYRSLMLSIELRHAPFVLWITDLAQPDRLFRMPFSLPFLGEYFNLLPILMVAAMVVQQKLMPKPATAEAAQQQKMMMIFMPIFMGVILYQFASGLNLYILTSTVTGIIEQWVIRRHLAAKDAAGPLAGK